MENGMYSQEEREQIILMTLYNDSLINRIKAERAIVPFKKVLGVITEYIVTIVAWLCIAGVGMGAIWGLSYCLKMFFLVIGVIK
jgi:hypothetical protein